MIPMRRTTGLALGMLVALGALGAFAAFTAAQQPAVSPGVTVFKSPTCGCCAKWNTHMSDAGFAVTSTDMPDVSPVKDKHGVPANLRSCHTALVDGYVIEGHVPADVVKSLLRDRPAGVVGIAVPGMPLGSPGMEVPDGRKDAYAIVAFDKAGRTRVYATR